MRMRQQQNRAQKVPAEVWMAKKLRGTGLKWNRQVQWGFRLFDFWCAPIGINVEVDGQTHDDAADLVRDQTLMKRSGIVVLRVRNYSEADAMDALLHIAGAEEWNTRRQRLGLKAVQSGKHKVVA